MNGRGSRIVVGVVGITRMVLGLLIVLAPIVMAPVSDTLAQAGGTAVVQNTVPGGRPPDAIDRATGLAEQPSGTLPMPAQPASPYIPDRRVYSPEIGREVEVPGHFAQRTPDGRVVEPPMTIPTPNGGPPVFLPGGVQPDSGVPAELVASDPAQPSLLPPVLGRSTLLPIKCWPVYVGAPAPLAVPNGVVDRPIRIVSMV